MLHPVDNDRQEHRSDGVRLALITNRLQSIARHMQNTLFRTGRSGILNTAHDFSCVVLTRDCRLLVAAPVGRGYSTGERRCGGCRSSAL